MILAGHLSDWSVSDLLQILRVTSKTASLEVEGSLRKGILYFREGKIVGAELHPTGGVNPPSGPADMLERIVEAAYVLQLLTEGSFSIGDLTLGDTGVSVEPAEVLEAAQVQLELEGEIRRTGLDDDTPLRLVSRVSEPVLLSPDEWRVLADLTAGFSLAELEWRLGRSRAVSAIRSFQEGGMVERGLRDAAAGAGGRAGAMDPQTAATGGGPELAAVGGDGESEGGASVAAEMPSPAAGAVTMVEPMPHVAPEDVPEPVPVEDVVEPVPVEDVVEPVPVEDVVEPVPVEDVVEPVPVEDVVEPAPVVMAPNGEGSTAVEDPLQGVELESVEAATSMAEDDEARLLAEARGRVEVRIVDEATAGEESAERRASRGVVSRDTVLVPGVLSELNRRFRPADEER